MLNLNRPPEFLEDAETKCALAGAGKAGIGNLFLISTGDTVRIKRVLEEVIAVGKADNNEQIDADILQCKADILHARDIMPSHKKKTSQEQKPQKTVENISHSTDAAQTSTEKEKPAEQDIRISKLEKNKQSEAGSEPNLKETQAGEKTASLSQNDSKQPLKNIIHPHISKKTASLPAKQINHPDTVKHPELKRKPPNQSTPLEVHIEQTEAGQNEQPQSVTVHKEETEIPKFDLAEEIMAEQRKITSIRRKAPGQRSETQSQPLKTELADFTTEWSTAAQSDQDRIIAEIVARDIERMCRRDTLDAQQENFKGIENAPPKS